MKSNKQKRQELAEKRGTKEAKRQEENQEQKRRRQWARLRAGDIALVDRTKLHSYGRLIFSKPSDNSKNPRFYEDRPFTCKDCGKQELWSAHQQKWWYEQMGGNVETTAVRCRECRAKERARKEEANRIREEGLERKRQEQERR